MGSQSVSQAQQLVLRAILWALPVRLCVRVNLLEMLLARPGLMDEQLSVDVSFQ